LLPPDQSQLSDPVSIKNLAVGYLITNKHLLAEEIIKEKDYLLDYVQIGMIYTEAALILLQFEEFENALSIVQKIQLVMNSESAL
jgi:hypothetical protein